MSLELRGVGVSIGGRAIVRDVSALVAAGEVAVLLGRNGAGKTTLIRGLAGLLPASGRILLGETDVAALPPGPRSRLIGFMAQELASSTARLSVLELLLLAQNGDRVAWQASAGSLERAGAVLEMLRLEPLAERMPGELSGGQRQMVHLALALVRRPRVLLLDEPTSALDLANQLHLLATVRDYTRREGISTVLILHDLSLAARFADTAIMLEGGTVAHAGPSRDVITERVIEAVYAVSCRVLPVEGELRAVYPLAPLADQARSVAPPST